MFGSKQLAERVDALSRVVDAQSALIGTLSKQLDIFRDDARGATQRARVASAEAHLLKALAAALMAEIAARSDEPYADLASISKRARFTAKEFSGKDAGSDYIIKESIKMIVQHAERYLRRGDPAGKLDATN